MTTDLLNAGIGDIGRLQFILDCIKNQKPLYNTDERYLKQKYQELETKLEILSRGKKKDARTLVSDEEIDRIVEKALVKENQDISSEIPPKPQKRSRLKRLFRRK